MTVYVVYTPTSIRFQEMSEHRKTVFTLTKSKELLEKELSTIKELLEKELSTIKEGEGEQKSLAASRTGSGSGNTAQELHSTVERLHILENERKVKHAIAIQYNYKTPAILN